MPPEGPIITGYYRYTDIWFEWSKTIPEADGSAPLKAILSHDALVDPNHPLHIDGVNGVQLYIGTLETGENRLLFSSKQVDYIRYWLYAMGLTKTIVPLPYSDCLLTESNLKHRPLPRVYPDGGSLRSAIKEIDKSNKRLKGANPLLGFQRHAFDRVRTLWAEKKGVWCALDFESWERDHTILTEFGWSYVGWKNGTRVENRGHLIVEEARNYTNSQYVPDYRYNYIHGKSEIVKKAMFKQRIHNLLKSFSEFGTIFLVFHDNSQDIKDLQKLEVDLEGLTYIGSLPDNVPQDAKIIVDTADLIGALLGEENDKRKLSQTCRLLQIHTEFLHNAGNDAHYTLLAMQSLADGSPLDIQREERWPNQTTTGVKVELKPWQDDSDYSDEEGVIPLPSGFKDTSY